jgi:Ca2+:H+ antiporter
MTPLLAGACFAGLFGTIILAAFGVVREADALARRLGEPYGTLVLTLSVVAIEAMLIAAVMLGPAASEAIGRDSVFSAMMIVLNLVTGICLLAGALRYGEQEYNAPGAVTFIATIFVFAGIAFVLPNVVGAGAGALAEAQALGVAILMLTAYAGFLVLQTGLYRSDFMQPAAGTMRILLKDARHHDAVADVSGVQSGSAFGHAVMLVALILPIGLLSRDLAIVVDYGVARVGAPAAISGVLIAIIVCTPESVTAIRAALADQTQRAINLCLGAIVSTVGLTVPAVLLLGLVTGKTVVFGLSPADTALLVLTIGLTALTYVGHRTSAAQGLLHVLLFAVFALVLVTT